MLKRRGIRAKHIGDHAESYALSFLTAQGLVLIERNFACRFGEIDLIMSDDDCLVFTEVRYRSKPYYGGAIESVSYAKQQRLLRSAYVYMVSRFKLQSHELCPSVLPTCRFDVIGLSSPSHNPQTIQCTAWVKQAFEADRTSFF